MNVNGTTLTAIVVAPLIVGSLLGVWYGTRRNMNSTAGLAATPNRSNYIRMEIRPGTKTAVVAPQIGDTVEWYPEATNTNPHPSPAVVQFEGVDPCSGHNPGDQLSSCLVNTAGHFVFDCINPTCVDPGMDPRSTTGPPGFIRKPKTEGAVTTPPGPVAAPAVAGVQPPALPTIMIFCDASHTPQVPTGKDPIAAFQSQQISWVAGAVSDFTINIPPKFCQEDTSGSGQIKADQTAVCTVAADAKTDAPYAYSVSGACPGTNQGSFKINVAKWPPK